MSADYSRWPQRRHDYTAVRLQQGRVITDADWNEQSLAAERREHLETIDGLGRAVVPTATADAFKITAAGADLSIGVGRAYLDGLLVENTGGRGPFDPVTAELGPAGPVNYSTQPWLPTPPALPPAPYAAYLKAWQRERTAVEDPGLVEVALGVDTAARAQTVWQVRTIPVPAGTTCATVDALIAAAEPAAGGRLTTTTAVVPGQPDPCRVVPGGGYTGLENQLYRVEVHRAGVVGGAGGATFKWSRDGGAVAARVLSINTARDRVVVDSLGRDDVLSIHDGDWIEITDDDHELGGVPGELRRVAVAGGVDEASNTILLASALPAAGTAFPVDAQGKTIPGRNTRIRRWDQAGKVLSAAGAVLTDLGTAASTGAITIPGAGVGVLLEHGIVVRFALPSGRFRTGDYWLFAARTADASVEALGDAPPIGIHVHVAPLAIVDGAGSDCRTIVPPLADMVAMYYLAGDGQEATPSYVAPAPVPLPVNPTVGVERGSLPLAGRTVRFTLLDGADAGTIDGVGPTKDVVTGADGRASVAWVLGWAGRDSQKRQGLRAQLLDGLGQLTGLPVEFSARLRTADEVAYDPANCGGPAGPSTVQAALDDLCNRTTGDGCCRSVRAGDDIAEAIRASTEVRKGHVCLCLDPGVYELDEDRLGRIAEALKEVLSLSISGHGAQLLLASPWIIEAVGSVTLQGFELANASDGLDVLLELKSCASVVLDGLTASLTTGTDRRTVVRIGSADSADAGPVVRVRNCTIVNGKRDGGPQKVFALEALPDSVGRLVKLVDADATAPETITEVRAIMDQPEAIRLADAETTDRLAATHREVMDAPTARSFARLTEVVRNGSPLAPARVRTLLERAKLVADFAAKEADAPTAIELLDGAADVWIEDNILRGKLVLYGSGVQVEFEQRLRKALSGFDWTGIEPNKGPSLPAGVGHLRVTGNELDRIALAAEAAVRLGRFLESKKLAGISIYDSITIEANTINAPYQSIAAESVSMSANTVGGRFEPDMGFVLAAAGTVIGNIGKDFGRLFLAAPSGAEMGNRRMVVNPQGVHG